MSNEWTPEQVKILIDYHKQYGPKTPPYVADSVPFCNEGCYKSLREDRRAGLIYPPVLMEDGRIVGWEEGHKGGSVCAYCRSEVGWYPEQDEITDDEVIESPRLGALGAPKL